MKHLIIFLNYCQSRLDNPVYRIFSTESLCRKNSALLFLQKPLDERDLQHEVSELRKKQPSEDITFHICANLIREGEGDIIVQTIRLIRRLFQADIERHYPTFVYGQMPGNMNADDETRKFVWKNLVLINNAVADFIECRLLSNVYLYTDESQNSLAKFIFNTCHLEISFEKLSARLPIKQGELFDETPAVESIDFPPIFGSFDTIGMRYPEAETRAYLRQYFLLSALNFALPKVNETKTENCNKDAQRILSYIPIETSRICLQEESFINLSPDENAPKWQKAETFWEANIDKELHGLSEFPREDWFFKIRQRVETLYQGRFREVGTDYFFKLENKKQEDYCRQLFAIIYEEYLRTVLNIPYSPEAQKNILRIIINILQTKVIEIQKLKTDTAIEINIIENQINDIKERWNSLSIISRLRGKDNMIMSEYRNVLINLMIKKGLLPGCDFATKLLNNLIPLVSAMLEKCEEVQHLFSATINATEEMLKESDPTELFGVFDNKILQEAKDAIAADTESLEKVYLNIMAFAYDETTETDNNSLIARIRTELRENIDKYLDERIEDCSLPPIINMSIVERISHSMNAIGGFNGFIDSLKRRSTLPINIKKNCQNESKYIMIAPELTEPVENVEHIVSDDFSQIQLLNVLYGLTLQDLDGFTGQRMFVEPSIF